MTRDDPAGVDDPALVSEYQTLPVVGLGGSAGSIRALQSFFKAAPPDSGLAFVIVLHLSPTHESALQRIVEGWTEMPVRTPADGERLERNTVYVLPPRKHVSAVGGRLGLTDAKIERDERLEVDLFFRSLADAHGPYATAVVLSGADGDGALGIKRVKERGGLTIAQDPAEAEHPSMPESAIATRMVDWVLPVAAMPTRVAEYASRQARLRLPDASPAPKVEATPVTEEALETALQEVLGLIRARTGRDFTYYKRATVVRRIARRIQVNGLEDIRSYVEFLRTHPGEAGALLQDLLISVTNFFRDREAFNALERVLPDIFRDKGPGDCVRVWVPACATGEETYSVAILLWRYARTLDAPPLLQIFGTDLDENAIQVARAALYPVTIGADVDDEDLRHFFTREARGYRVRREIREIVLFAAHDLLKDASFSRMDLISCRNLLIYLNRDAQRRAVGIFHFALRGSGTLLLGSSETIEHECDLFEPVDKKHRVYRRVAAAKTMLPVPAGAGIPASRVTAMNPVVPGASLAQAALRRAPERGTGSDQLSPSELHVRLLERLAPPSLVIDADHRIVHLSQRAADYLQFATGEPTTDVLRVIHPKLRADLRAALAQAAETSTPVEIGEILLDSADDRSAVRLRVYPARELASGFMLVVIESRASMEPRAVTSRDPMQQPIIEKLERELDRMKARLRDNVEQYEAKTQELKAGNEELQAMNEELRTATEELETSREEMQSINEELATVNVELKSKLDELAHANSDLHTLMASTNIATLFLDRTLRILRYTPSAVTLFNIIETDLGRPLNDLRHHLEYPDLSQDALRVLDKLVPIEREVRAENEWYLARILPYRTVEDRIAGVVLTFVDITTNKAVEEELRQSQERLQLIVENARDYAIFSMDLNRRITTWNSGAARILGYSRDEALGKAGDIIFTLEDREAGAPEEEASRALSDGRAVDERWHVRKDGSRFWGNGATMAMHDIQGRAIGFVKVFRDETRALHAKQALEKSRQELMATLREVDRARADAEAAGRAKDHFLAVLSHELRTPLTPVMMAARALSRLPKLPSEAREALAMIERNVQLEAQFIDDLLDVTRISRGKLDLVQERVDVHDAVRRGLEVSRTEIEAKGHRLTVDLAAAEHHVRGDARRLQQVFWNLLKNAAKFTPPNGWIRVASWNDSGRIVVEVRDSGVGFDPAASERIFSAFEQASASTGREFGGLGLGLAIVKATVEGHGGTIHAHSEGQGRGAAFCVALHLETDGACRTDD